MGRGWEHVHSLCIVYFYVVYSYCMASIIILCIFKIMCVRIYGQINLFFFTFTDRKVVDIHVHNLTLCVFMCVKRSDI